MDEDTISVSKGVFIFNNNIKRSNNRGRRKRTFTTNKTTDDNEIFASNLWYQQYANLKNILEENIMELNDNMFSSVLSELVQFVGSSRKSAVEEIPTAALLTGINMPDHAAQFSTLINKIQQNETPHVACLYSQDCVNIKNMIENMINKLMNSEGETIDDEDEDHRTIKKHQMNLSVLQCWYNNVYGEKKIMSSPKKQRTNIHQKALVVIIPDFESFTSSVLQKFILIVSCYIKVLPFVFIFGIATSLNTLHTSLSYQIMSKINIRVFKSQPSIVYLDNVLENAFFDTNFPFHLGGNIFNLFIDLFLFYDLSVNNFITNVKYAMAEHFCFGNAMSLCTLSKPQTREMVENFTHNDFENVRQLLSFRKLVESETYENRIKLLTDDDYFKDVLIKHLRSIQKYLRRFHLFLKVLHVLVNDLPKAPLGKKIRELYAVAVSRDITKSDEYKESFQLLGFLSKVELISKLSAIIDILSPKLTSVEQNKIAEFVNKLEQYLKSMNDFNMEELQDAVEEIETEALADETIDSRQQFREKLLGMAKQKSAKQLNKYEQLRKEVLDLLSNAFEEYLVEPKSFYLHEIFFFDDVSIQNNIVGTHRTAIHNALNDPQYYLQCSCCEIPNSTSIRHTMPDICIAYKLHLECGKMINLYDWLQAFLSIVDPSDADEESDRYVKPELQYPLYIPFSLLFHLHDVK
ncbi:unnamed protein product [Acanthoscelides obtectus]|uniref:Origin recognition complex subunit 3 n=1 Tax=Acanthoscelides obtectus TaxID=200917 RepID=A0A9P0LSJ6_ACAOB|nr:unnamed protein product [Acanthoscelides obtectus]CAK1664343.1 Origin recognition complex subunit 3 [Acanthoscelides obtectus]